MVILCVSGRIWILEAHLVVMFKLLVMKTLLSKRKYLVAGWLDGAELISHWSANCFHSSTHLSESSSIIKIKLWIDGYSRLLTAYSFHEHSPISMTLIDTCFILSRFPDIFWMVGWIPWTYEKDNGNSLFLCATV